VRQISKTNATELWRISLNILDILFGLCAPVGVAHNFATYSLLNRNYGKTLHIKRTTKVFRKFKE
jgi:hypothetical protein